MDERTLLTAGTKIYQDAAEFKHTIVEFEDIFYILKLAPLRKVHVGSRLRHLDLRPRLGVFPLLGRLFDLSEGWRSAGQSSVYGLMRILVQRFGPQLRASLHDLSVLGA
ncbi:hypothetical protein CGGC5_v017304 [Colletotrichum fructicola Nara gc5]|uniref:Uncharacterized protein n=1 Tax=Colletotrichum fructicola (strain Nara gc5) TaxID=1213859 RepID=A0A7J6IBV2_COLFN|nr:hypothetical protein CFRS1_v015734 [Colletotrichum fructicola]KAF4473705.1 hypothetical protein CGGC5_v017304 [Colletotrichum fructicola Nara gc5]